VEVLPAPSSKTIVSSVEPVVADRDAVGELEAILLGLTLGSSFGPPIAQAANTTTAKANGDKGSTISLKHH
jgi:hypothetical protein